MAQTNGSHLGPDQDCTVDDAELPNKTYAGSSLLKKVTSQSALVSYAFKVQEI
jgi:hypothetical protein